MPEPLSIRHGRAEVEAPKIRFPPLRGRKLRMLAVVSRMSLIELVESPGFEVADVTVGVEGCIKKQGE